MINAGTSDDARDPFAAFVCDSETMESLAAAISDFGWMSDSIRSGGIAKAVAVMGSLNLPRILVVDVSESQSPLDDIGHLAEVCPPDIQVIAIGDKNDISLFRDLLDAGVSDYILKPVSRATFTQSLTHILDAREALVEPSVSPLPDGQKVIAIIGTRGGVGASTIATSLAWVFAKDLKQNTCLIDLDLYFGTTALTFEIEPGRGLVDALENHERIDNLLIDRALIKVNDTLSLIAAEAPLTQSLIVDHESVPRLIEAINESVDVVVMDVPGHFAVQHASMMEYVSDIVIVSDLSLAATRDTIRLLAFAQDSAPTAKVHVLVNKLGTGIANEVPLVDFETSIERSVNWSMPMDEKTMMLATRSAKPMPDVAAGSRSAKLVLDIANRIAGYSPEKVAVKKKASLMSFIKGGK